MTEPSGWSPAPEGRLPPVPAPPMAAVDNREILYLYFLRNENSYTKEALQAAAETAGHAPDDIAAAWERSQVGVAGKTSSTRFVNAARLIVVGLYLGTFLLLVFGTDISERTYTIGPPILGVLMLFLGLLSLVLVGRTRMVSKEPLLALAGMLAVPFVMLVIVAGLCLSTTTPTFLPRAV